MIDAQRIDEDRWRIWRNVHIQRHTAVMECGLQRIDRVAREYGNGMWACDVRPLAALRAALPTWFPRTNEIIRQLGSHNLLTTPSRAALDDETGRQIGSEKVVEIAFDGNTPIRAGEKTRPH